jgi:hypothetical protein
VVFLDSGGPGIQEKGDISVKNDGTYLSFKLAQNNLI